MHEKLKWIFLYGGGAWGPCFALITMIIRGILDKPMAFGSFPIFLIICISGGIFLGAITYKYVINKKFEKQTYTLEKVSKGLAVWGILLSSYGLFLHFILVPLNYENTAGAYIFKWVIMGIGFYITNNIREDKKESK
ncbi:hypothetical protein OW666_19715, partial [Acinetobacter baumannii]|uniref:hypothetical protein n=1 Tax=Acinetobacter baumannii TaxID=470 RepID=UPI0024DE7994